MTQAARGETRREFRIDLSGTFIRRTDLSNADLEGADLRGADCAFVNFRGANLRDAMLDGTNLKGADLTGVRNLTRAQIARAIIDDQTILPSALAE
ncbi:pentapeptide repeat-containing protein [Methylocystis suflitae]|uniref:pentapeptide repeat-containing protein n=1 Tax=Methylocystis suflitae TaxID=2951405 RepID=UPI00210B3B3E|nr:pentapeptide repeat-containing protein [Methylocystis suflitae]MCQ4188822.1 pentapeptide repeat-containing protein [Methylocystis suflitae]